jgi:uncharacterized membrane protein YqaE (UPF0057 family)
MHEVHLVSHFAESHHSRVAQRKAVVQVEDADALADVHDEANVLAQHFGRQLGKEGPVFFLVERDEALNLLSILQGFLPGLEGIVFLCLLGFFPGVGRALEERAGGEQ